MTVKRDTPLSTANLQIDGMRMPGLNTRSSIRRRPPLHELIDERQLCGIVRRRNLVEWNGHAHLLRTNEHSVENCTK